MSKVFRMSGVIMIVVAILLIALAGAALAAGNGYIEPAPESGDGVPDGSGFNGVMSD